MTYNERERKFTFAKRSRHKFIDFVFNERLALSRRDDYGAGADDCHALFAIWRQYLKYIHGYRESILKLEIRSVERGICPIATSTMNELFL